ncbi:MAG: FKBP-type peptidyl-prolyl cis-trans isomerase [Bacteroidota bacterium]
MFSINSHLLFVLFLLFFSSLLTAQEIVPLADQLAELNIEATETDYGLFYKIDQIGTGRKPQVGDYLALNFKGKLLDGTLFEASELNDPFVFQVGYRQVIRGWDLGIREFPLGSKGVIYIPPNLAYGQRGAGQLIPPNSALQFEVEVVKILTESEYDAYMEELEAKEQAAYQAEIEAQFVADKKLIQDYALTNRMRTKRTASGLSYAITKKGKGANAQVGDELAVTYEGFLLNGEPFDATKGKDTYQFTLGKGKVIKGWDEGLLFFNEGAEGTLLIPSRLAYGPRAIYEKNVAVPANSVLIFKIKVESIKRAEEDSGE